MRAPPWFPTSTRYAESALRDDTRARVAVPKNERVFLNLALIRTALESGFSIREAQILIHGFSKHDTAIRTMASTRLHKSYLKSRRAFARLRRAEKLLKRAAACERISLADCANILLPTTD